MLRHWIVYLASHPVQQELELGLRGNVICHTLRCARVICCDRGDGMRVVRAGLPRKESIFVNQRSLSKFPSFVFLHSPEPIRLLVVLGSFRAPVCKLADFGMAL